jgi:hypothetical protein
MARATINEHPDRGRIEFDLARGVPVRAVAKKYDCAWMKAKRCCRTLRRSALKSYRESLAIAERLAHSDPGNAGWQRDLAISYARLASVYRQSKDRGKALAALRQGEAIMDRLAKLSPDNAVWKRDLAWFDQQIAALAE